jgi:hypothetical protein
LETFHADLYIGFVFEAAVGSEIQLGAELHAVAKEGIFGHVEVGWDSNGLDLLRGWQVFSCLQLD